MAREVQLVFYDLEWTNNDIIQLGAAAGPQVFSQAVRPGSRMDPFVRKKIKLDVREGPTGKRQIFDLYRKMFLPTLDPKDAFEDFLTWLEDLQARDQGRDIVLVSHGNSDILMLHWNFTRLDLQERLYRVVSHFVDFQDYLQVHFKDMGKLGMQALVKTFCQGETFRLHCADEDARALQAVCANLHQMRGICEKDYTRNLARMRRVALKSIAFPKSCREIRELASRLNPGSNFVLLPNIHGVYNIFTSSTLFSRIEPPDNFQFDVGGYVVSHAAERYLHREEYKERTRLELACYIGNAYFIQFHLINGASKSPLSLHCPERWPQGQRPEPLEPGTPVQAVVLVTATNHVKLQDIEVQAEAHRGGSGRGRRTVDVSRLLADLTKLKRGERVKTPPQAAHTPDRGWDPEEGREARGGFEYEEVAAVQQAEADVDDVLKDKELLARRGKQVDTFKKTEDYKAYTDAVGWRQRTAGMPSTPNKSRRFSRRQWDGAVKQWKLRVHEEARRIHLARREGADTAANVITI